MIRYRGFRGFFIMKRNDDGKWEYLSKYWKRKENIKLTFSEQEVKYFDDTTIEGGRAFSVFNETIKQYSGSKIVLYASIDGTIHRVKYYNPESSPRITKWYDKEDFYCYIPRNEIR